MNMTTLILYLLLGLTAATAAVSLLTIFVRARNVTWGHLRTAMKKGRSSTAMLLVLVLIFSLCFGGLKHMDAKKSATATVTLNFAEASTGRNTNGTRYNMAELTCDEVLEMVIEDGALENVTAEQLAECLRVEPAVQGNVNTEYRIHFTATPETSHLDPENVVTLLAANYKDYYISRHAMNYQLLELDENLDFSGLDYLDAVELLSKELKKVRNFMYGMDDKSSSFMDSKGNTFYSIAAKLDQLEEVQIDGNLVSYILYNGITRDAQGYVSRLEYDNKQLDFNKQRALASYDVHNQAVSLYSEEMTRVVLVPTWDENGEYYMGRTKVGIDELSVDAEEHSQDAAKYLEKISSNQLTISGTDAVTEGMIRQIYATILSYAAEAKNAAQEYTDTQMNQCIRVHVEGASLVMTLAHTLVAAIFFLVTVWLAWTAKALPAREKKHPADTKVKSPAGQI